MVLEGRETEIGTGLSAEVTFEQSGMLGVPARKACEQRSLGKDQRCTYYARQKACDQRWGRERRGQRGGVG